MKKMKTQEDVLEVFYNVDVMERDAIIRALPKDLEKGRMRFHDAMAVCVAGLRNPPYTKTETLTMSDHYKLRTSSAETAGEIALRFAPSRDSLGVPFFAVMNQAANDRVENVRIVSLGVASRLLDVASDFNPDGVVNALTRMAVVESPSYRAAAAEATKILEKTLMRLPEFKADSLMKRMLEKFENVSGDHPSLKPWSLLVEHLGSIRGDIFDATARKAISLCQREGQKTDTSAGVLLMKCMERSARDGKRADADVVYAISPLAVQSRAINTKPNSFML